MSQPPRFVPPHLLPNFEKRVPEGDSLERLVCRDCGHVHYMNPKIIVGSVISHQGRILLCRRAIEPRRGFWTIPAGFMEERETAEAGARREAMEEAGAAIAIDAMLAVYSIARISQVQIIYRATLMDTAFAPGIESLETVLFAYDEIPWGALAFPSVQWALTQWRQVEGCAIFAPFASPLAGAGAEI
ncbi:MAG: NUDIX hydrolase [Alphaproteobacteria bacterium]|nr:NUDIX hydrolase [Alphaproteobacteria bacterium]